MLSEHLSQAQVSGLLALGAVFWGLAAVKVRYAGHIFYANDLRRIGTVVGTVPLGYTLIRIAEKLLSIHPKARLTSTTIMVAIALLLDGTAFMWFPTLYENPTLRKQNAFSAVSFSRMGAAWILGGVGMCLSIALLT